ncbi:MAG: alkaline D-peptidase [Nonomuraea muscovyensis]|nr:alkaline D-peptidase [Nonomuraea muscovyensis]
MESRNAMIRADAPCGGRESMDRLAELLARTTETACPDPAESALCAVCERGPGGWRPSTTPITSKDGSMSHRVFSADRALRAVAVSALTVGLAVAAPSAARSSTDAPHAAQLQQLARKLVAAGAPGVIVRVDDGLGRPVEIAEQAPWTRRDHLLKAGDEVRIGSSTKTMTATLVLQLAAEGKLALTDPVEKWLPGKVPDGKAITLRMLLNHTSGLYDYTEDAAILPSILGKDRRRWTSAELLAVGVKHDPLFAPGAKWSYSNTNYAALGAVLERATGSSLADLVRDRIARPLGLKHTYYATDATWRGPHAPGYEPDAAHMPPSVPAAFRHFAGPRRHGHVDVSGNDPGWGGAAGAVVSTAGDWSRFHTALMSGKLLPAAQLAHMRTTVPVDPRQPDGPGYGLGIQTGTTPCGTFWGHDGGIPGYLTANVTDGTGSRTVGILVSTEIWAEFEADPKIAKATQALQIAAICAMFGKPVPAAAQAG